MSQTEHYDKLPSRDGRSMIREELVSLIDHMRRNELTLSEARQIIERALLERALADNGQNQCAAADAMGIHRNSFRRVLLRLGIETKRPTKVRYSPPKFSHIETIHSAPVGRPPVSVRFHSRTAQPPPPRLSSEDQRKLKELERELYPNYRDIEDERDYPDMRKA